MKLVVGLGNPGTEYERSRHNVGWMAVDVFARRRGISGSAQAHNAVLVRRGELALVKPLTYMNDSGVAVKAIAAELGAAPEDVIVIADDLALPLGMVRVRRDGASGGHRGLESVIAHLGTSAFPRLRLGIGPRPEGVGGRAFVLAPFLEEEAPVAAQMVETAADALDVWLAQGIEACMNRFNRRIGAAQDDSAAGAAPGAQSKERSHGSQSEDEG